MRGASAIACRAAGCRRNTTGEGELPTLLESGSEKAENNFPICRCSKVAAYDDRLSRVTAHGVCLLLDSLLRPSPKPGSQRSAFSRKSFRRTPSERREAPCRLAVVFHRIAA